MSTKKFIEKHIAVEPDIQHGKPRLRGTRVPVYSILEVPATGMSFDDVEREFSPLTDEQIQACIHYAGNYN